MPKKIETELEATVSFPMAANKERTNEIIDQLWDSLNKSLNLKKEFRRTSFHNHIILLASRRHWFRISARKELQIYFHVYGSQAVVSANKHAAPILGFFNTFRRDEFKHMHIVGAFSTNDSKIVPTKTASLIDRSKVVRISNKLRAAMKPIGQMIELEREDQSWLIITANFDHAPILAFFFHMTKDGVIPSDLIRSVLQNCVQVGKEIKPPLSSV